MTYFKLDWLNLMVIAKRGNKKEDKWKNENLLVTSLSILDLLFVVEALIIACSKKARRFDSFFGGSLASTSSSSAISSLSIVSMLVRLFCVSPVCASISDAFEINPHFDEFESETFPESVERDAGWLDESDWAERTELMKYNQKNGICPLFVK